MIIVPVHLWNPNPVKADVFPRVISGGEALNGDEDVIQTDGGGRWEITYSEIDLDGPDALRVWDQWTSYLAGGARVVLAPVLLLETGPRPIGGDGALMPSDLHYDDIAFPTVVRMAAPYIVARVAANAPLRATSVQIEVTLGARLRGGERFSIGDRAYKVERVTARAGQTATCIITPPLRAPIVTDMIVNFDWPVVRAKAVVGQSLAADVFNGQFSTVSLSLVEDFSA